MGFLDEKFYTDINTGEKISLRNASTLGVNTTYSNNSISVYDKSTNTHHQISEPFDTQDEAIAYMNDFNKQIRGEIIEPNHSPSSQAEIERYEARRGAREQEVAAREQSKSSVFLSGDSL